MSAEPQRTDARALVGQVVQACRDQAPSAAHRLQWQAQLDSEGSAVHIWADPEALSLALRNLVDNAVNYSP